MSFVQALALAVFVLDAVAIVRAILRHHGVATTLAWVFSILACPGFGALMYFWLAVPRVGPAAERKQSATRRWRAERGRRPGAPRTARELLPEGQRSMLDLASALTGLEATRGNAVDLLIEDVRAFERIESALREAKRSVWAAFFIVRNDETGRRFLDLLAQKAREGLEVRLLYDGLGSMGLDAGSVRRAGGRAEVFAPLGTLARRWSFNLRNHRKIVVIDGEIGFTGGMNVGDEYSGRSRRKGMQHFRDSHLALRGPAVGDLSQTFAEDWLFATEEELEVPPRPDPLAGLASPGGPDSIVSIVPSGPDQEYNASGMVYFAGVNAARQRVYLTSPYFIPDEPLLQALIGAALRGVDVRLLVPRKSDVHLATLAGRSYYAELRRAGVRIFEYLPSMLHAKTMVVDGLWGMVGSANVDIRSFLLNFEIGAVVHDPTFAMRLETAFLNQLQDSREVTEQILDSHPTWLRLASASARLLSPLL